MTATFHAENLGAFFVPSIEDVEAIKVQARSEKGPLDERDRFGLVLARMAILCLFRLPTTTLAAMTDRTDCALELRRATGGSALNRVKVQPCRGAVMTIARRDLTVNDVSIMVQVQQDNRIARVAGWCWSLDVDTRGERTSDPQFLAMRAGDLRPLAELTAKAGVD